MEATGKIHKIFPAEQVTDTFRKRELILEYAPNPMYPQYVKFEFIQDSVEILDRFQEGQDVEVSFDLSGREWTSPQGDVKYFTSLKGWRVQPAGASGGAGQSAAPHASQPTTQAAPPPATEPIGDDSEDLPF